MTIISSNRFDQSRKIVAVANGTCSVRDGRFIPRATLTRDAVNLDAVATLIYSGTIYPPDTIFSEYASVGMGGTLELDGSRVDYQDLDLFDRPLTQDYEKKTFDPIQLLCDEFEEQQLDLDNCVLLLSEGKDSTGIALALAELGRAVDCVTFVNSDTNLDFIKTFAKQLGHRHTTIEYSSTQISEDAISRLANVLEPSVDQAFLSYLTLPHERFKGKTLLDGMGNDVYMGHLPTADQLKATRVSQWVGRIVPRYMKDRLKSHLFPNQPYAGLPLRSFSECQGLYVGFDASLVEQSVGGRIRTLEDIDNRWETIGFERARASTRGRYLDTYSFAGKTIGLAEMVSGRVFFPWASESIAERYQRLAQVEKFDWKRMTNKVPLRKAIASRIEYSQPKIGFRAPVVGLLTENRALIERAVNSSVLLGDKLKEQVKFRLSGSTLKLETVALFALWELAQREYR